MSLAFIVLAHKNAAQVARLVRALQSPAHSVFVHVDSREEGVARALQASLPQGARTSLVVPRVAARWGSFGIVEATLTSLRAMRAAGVRAGHVVLMSGQDYPLVGNEAMDAFFARHRGRQFIECFALDEPNRWTPYSGRYQASARVHGFHLPVRSRWLSLPVHRRLPGGMRAYGGAQWWALSGDCVDAVLHTLDQQPQIERYFRHTFIPDEAFFQTMVKNSAWRDGVDTRHLRYVDFSRANPTAPAVLTTGDIDVIYREPDALIARKFDTERDAQVLDLIDERRRHTQTV